MHLHSNFENAPVLEIEDFGFCGYDYRVDIQDGKTFGYLKWDNQENWTFSSGDTPSEADTSDPVSYESYTLNELKEELESELRISYIESIANANFKKMLGIPYDA